MELLKQATNSISKCKLIPRNLCGEGISIGSPVNMCTIGSKVIWPTGGVISHSLIPIPDAVSVVVWRSLCQDDQSSVWCPCCPCAMSVLLSLSGSVFPKVIPMMFLWWEQKTTHSACIQLFS